MDGKRVGTGNLTIKSMDIEVFNDREMTYFGQMFASTLKGDELLLLQGPLGAGKSTFTKGVGLSLSVQESIISPTFVLVREYGNPIRLVHVDLYRVDTVEELQEIGIQDILDREAICVIEWADKFPALQQWATYQLRFSILSETVRKVEVYG